jgi:glycosyltransferase involved in cell wall biosynthesis
MASKIRFLSYCVKVSDYLKILLFNWRCPKHPQAGGAEKATYEIAKRWVSWGNDVHWVSGGYSGCTKQDNVDGITVSRLGGKYSVYPLSILRYLTTFNRKYDVVIDEINTIPFFTPLFVKVPHVAFIHQLAANVLFEELPSGQARFLTQMEPFILRLYGKTIMFTSKSTKEDLISIGISPANLYEVNYGVNRFIYKLGRNKSANPHVLYLGRLKRFKGVHLLINAMAKIVEDLPDAKLTIVGNGDLEYERYLHWLTDKLDLNKNINFKKFGLNDSIQEKVELMQTAWVLVFPSAREGFGLVIIEANACGTTTIATNVPGLRETVRNSETGLLVNRNIDELTLSIKRLLTDNGLRNNLSQNAYIWSKQFDWDRTAQEMLDVLNNISKKNPVNVSF